jgi:hypothetical protein
MTRFATVMMTVMILAGGLAASTQAQSFGIFFGDEPSDFFAPERIVCLSDHQIRETIAGLGYTDIALNVPNERNVQVRATQGGWVYLLDFNFCTGEIEGRKPLRQAG